MKISFSPLTAVTTALLMGAFPLTAWANYVPPSDLGLPGPREGAGTRGCVFGNPGSLTLLMPESNVGWTTAAYPQFHWYTPLNVASFVEFTLYAANPEDGESDRTQVYQSRFTVSGDAGIASLQLPTDSGLPPLAVGQLYYWQVAIFCNANSESGDLKAGGWVERQEADATLEAALGDASETDIPDLYAANGYWFDAVDSLIALRQDHPEDEAVQAQWMDLLDSVGLASFAEQPLFSDAPVIDAAVLDCLDLSALNDLPLATDN